MDYKIRTILEGEDNLLQDFLYEAIFVPEGAPAPPKSIINQPELQVYIADFGKKKSDIGLVAEIDKKAAGAVWVKVFDKGIMRIEKKSKFPMYHNLLTRGPHL